MVGKMRHVVEDVLSASQLGEVVEKCAGAARAQLVAAELSPAAEGIAGFLGDHFRLALTVTVDHRLVKIPLFVKSMPLTNAPKASFIDDYNFFRKEMMVFKMMEDMETEGPNPWGVKAFLYNEVVLVMHDLAAQGYSILDQLQTFDLPHVRAALASLARFHAATATLETSKQRARGRSYRLAEEFGDIIDDCQFRDTPWIRTGAKLTADFIQQFSEKYKNTIPDLELKVHKQYLEACADLAETKDTLNVVVHKDLWANNIMFKYEDGVPTNAILVDFQCIRYAPPAFDVTFLWYLTTSRSFRKQHEAEVLRHYFTVFMASVDEETRLRLKGLGYDYEEFLGWVEKSRRLGVMGANLLYPYVLLDQASAREVFDDPATFEARTNDDRSPPVLAHALRSPQYLRRQLDVGEEFLELYLVN